MADDDEVTEEFEVDDLAEEEVDGPDVELDEEDLDEDDIIIDPELDVDDDDVVVDDDAVVEDDDDDAVADTPRTRRKKRDDDDEDDDDELIADDDVEADLDKILKDRMVTVEEDDDDEDEEVDVRGDGAERLQPKQQDEQLCPSCFLLVRATAPNCPVGDDDCPIFS
ncbi:MAG: hypothetical protein ABWZ99_18585 [Ilumatobacteraceae bacterium]